MRSTLIQLYWIAGASNLLALAILLRGIFAQLNRAEQLLSVMFTAISMLCWLAYFGKLNK